MHYDMKDGGRAYGVRGGNGCIRGVSHGQDGYYDMYNNFHPDPPKDEDRKEEGKIVIDNGPGFFDGMGEQLLDTMHAEWEKERARHLTLGESAKTLAGGMVIGTVAATFDPKDPVGSLRKTPRNIACVFGIAALYAVAGVLLLMASGALEGRHYGTFGLLLVPAILLLLAGVGLIRVMMNKRFLPDPSALHPGQRKNVEAAMRLQEVNADKKPRKTVVGILLVATGVLVAVLLIGMYLFAR